MRQQYAITIAIPQGMDPYEAQERMLQNFPAKIAGIEITDVRIVAGLVDESCVPIGPKA